MYACVCMCLHKYKIQLLYFDLLEKVIDILQVATMKKDTLINLEHIKVALSALIYTTLSDQSDGSVSLAIYVTMTLL